MDSVNWPGWPLGENPYGEEFDVNGRQRMMQGCDELKPLLEKYRSELGTNLLEIGPFFNPLITVEAFPHAAITYWDNDPHVLAWLKDKGGAMVADVDLQSTEQLAPAKFTSVIASQILNYVDYKKLLFSLSERVEGDGLLFINNVPNHGISKLLSDLRPESNDAIKQVLVDNGFEILEEHIVTTADPMHQQESRLLLVAQLKKS